MSPVLAGRFFNIIPASYLMGKHQKNSQLLFKVVLEILTEAYVFHIFPIFSLLQHVIKEFLYVFFFKKFFFNFIYLVLAALGFSCSRLALCFDTLASLAAALGLSCPGACGILVPHSGIEPTSTALEGRFLTTGPP